MPGGGLEVSEGSAPRQTADRSYIAGYLHLSGGGRHCRIEHRSARSGRPSALPATGGVVRHPPRLLPARSWGRGRPGRGSACVHGSQTMPMSFGWILGQEE